MELAQRDIQLFIKLNQASWLTTTQILYYFFRGKSANAVNKRMRKLVNNGLLFCTRHNSTEEYLYRITQMSKQVLLEKTQLKIVSITVPKRLPQNLRHFICINHTRCGLDLAIKQESGQLLAYFTDRELKKYLPDSKIIPDAITRFHINNKTYSFAIEYDNNTENPGYFARYKIKKYVEQMHGNNSFKGFAKLKVLVFADSTSRLISLIKQSLKYISKANTFYFTVFENLRINLNDPVFIEPVNYLNYMNKTGKIYQDGQYNIEIPYCSILDCPED